MIQKEVLQGGRKDKILKEEDKVIRPGNKWTPHVHSFLSFMHENGFDHVPKPYGISESGMEMVSFVDGIVYNGSKVCPSLNGRRSLYAARTITGRGYVPWGFCTI